MKPAVVKVITPLCRGLLKVGITPNMMTITGTSIVVLGSWFLLAQGRLLAALIIIGLALLTDLLDGTMARISDSGASTWGNFLDSTLDRIADGAVFLGLTYYLYTENDNLFIVSMISVAVSGIVPYARAKAESLNIECKGDNEHHKIEAIFKAFAKAIKMAVKRDPLSNYLPSTKGIL